MYGNSLKVQRLSIHENPSESVQDSLKKDEDIVSSLMKVKAALFGDRSWKAVKIMVTFYALSSNGTPTYPVLYLDTLKVSTIEQTAEETEATGGKGNAPLIVWDLNVVGPLAA